MARRKKIDRAKIFVEPKQKDFFQPEQKSNKEQKKKIWKSSEVKNSFGG